MCVQAANDLAVLNKAYAPNYDKWNAIVSSVINNSNIFVTSTDAVRGNAIAAYLKKTSDLRSQFITSYTSQPTTVVASNYGKVLAINFAGLL